MNIAVGSPKGGVKKSTIATNLAVWLYNQGHQIAAMDLDAGRWGNKSLTTILGQAEPAISIYQPNTSGTLKKLLRRLAAEVDFSVIDCPGGYSQSAETNLEVLRHSELLLVPVTPSFDDFEPLTVVEEIFLDAKRKNPLLEGRVIINFVDRRTRIGKDITGLKQAIGDLAPSLKVMNQTIRVDTGAFQTARLDGTVVVSGSKSGAKSELEALFTELLSDMVVTMSKHQQVNPKKQRIAYG